MQLKAAHVLRDQVDEPVGIDDVVHVVAVGERRRHLAAPDDSAAGPAATQILLPALPALQVDFGVSVAVAQLALSLSFLTMAVATLACGPWSDGIGRRPVAIGGLVLFVGGSTQCFVAPDIWTLTAGRVIQAAGGACGLVLARAIVRDVYGADKAASMISVLTMAMVIAPLISPILGGGLTDRLGWRSNFFVIGAFGVGILGLVLPFLRESLSAGAARGGILSNAGGLLREPLFQVYAGASTFSMGMFFSFIAAGPYVVMHVLGRPATV